MPSSKSNNFALALSNSTDLPAVQADSTTSLRLATDSLQCVLPSTIYISVVSYTILEPCTGKTQVVYFTYEPPGRFISKIRNLWFLNLLYLYTCTLFLLISCKLISLNLHYINITCKHIPVDGGALFRTRVLMYTCAIVRM